MDLLHQKNKTLSAESNWKIDFLCYFFPFVFNSLLFTYLMATRGFPAVGGYYLIHYLYNYSHGFLARGLVGEVLSLFFENIDDNVTKWTVFFFSVCLLVSASLCMGKALSKVKNDREKLFYVIFFLLVLFISPATFRNYFIDIKLDKMLWALTLFGVFCTDRKYLIWLAPIFCILATLVNPVFLFCSMILISIILLQEFHLSDKSVKNGIICAVSYGTINTETAAILDF